MKRTLFVLLAVIVITVQLSAQKIPIKVGKVGIADLEMKYYPGDSTVDAAVLCEYGYFEPNDFTFRFISRTKIFTKEGLNYLIFKAGVRSKGEVTGYVINLVDGVPVKERISNDHIYIEKYMGYTNLRIAPPNVVEGSVVDIEYVIKGGFPSYWQFQKRIPVRYSEIMLTQNMFFTFRLHHKGYEEIETKSYGHYIARDMPAFIPESYINSSKNYLTTLMIDFATVEYTHWNYAKTWKDVNDYFGDNEQYRGCLSWANLYLKDIAKEIKGVPNDTLERVKMALAAVHENVAWNEVISLYPAPGLADVWDDGSGTSADMNFMFLSLLRKLDIEANPFVISDRDNGIINPVYPTIKEFSSTISCVHIADRVYLVDASDKYSPFGLLPERSINGGGFEIIKGARGQWRVYSPVEPESKMYSVNLVMDEYGDLHGDFLIKHSDYAAVEFRRNYDTYLSVDEYLEDFESNYEGMFVVEYSNDVDSSDFYPVTEKSVIEIEGQANVMDDVISINPVLVERWTENPFKLENREYPVDFLTPRQEMSIINIALPDGYVVDQLPESMSLVNEGKSIVFQYILQQNVNNIQLLVKLDVKKAVFVQNEYAELKQLFDLLVQKQQEMIILKKSKV